MSSTGLRGGRQSGQAPGRRVLFLHGERRQLRGITVIDETIRAILEARSPVPLTFYTEFLDLNLFDGDVPDAALRHVLRRKYETRALDLIVPLAGPSLRTAVQNRADLFSNAPIVFVSVDRAAVADLELTRDITGTWLHQAWSETVALVGRLHPATTTVVALNGSSRVDRAWSDAARAQLGDRVGSIAVRHLTNQRIEDVVQEIAQVSEGVVVVVGAFVRDAAGRDLSTREVTSRLAGAARVPVYCLTAGPVGSGVVGGHVVDFEAHGRLAADLALRVLAGERPAPTADGTTVPMFDDRAVKRWSIGRRRLPPGSVIRFRQPSRWQRYREAFGSARAALARHADREEPSRIVGELLRLEAMLSGVSSALASCPTRDIDQEIETGLRRIVDELVTDRAIVWVFDDRAGEARATHVWTRPGVALMPTTIAERQFPSTFARLRRGLVVRLPPPEDAEESSTDRHSLAEIDARSTVLAPLIQGGAVIGALSVSSAGDQRDWPDELMVRLRLLADVFANALARQRAERAAEASARDIRDLAGRLLTAAEDERRRIARELHDGVNQDVAALSIALSALERGLPEGTPDDQRQQLARLQDRAVELAATVRHLSHELHPGVLEYAGLTAALRSHCRDFERDHRVALTLQAPDDLGAVPREIALSLYRVAQEALRNVARHAKASHAWVTVGRDASGLHLSIRDDGLGFDAADARARGGLGLVSLDERMRLVGGRLEIQSAALSGTEIRATVPLP